jgi:hypothetical protein
MSPGWRGLQDSEVVEEARNPKREGDLRGSGETPLLSYFEASKARRDGLA